MNDDDNYIIDINGLLRNPAYQRKVSSIVKKVFRSATGQTPKFKRGVKRGARKSRFTDPLQRQLYEQTHKAIDDGGSWMGNDILRACEIRLTKSWQDGLLRGAFLKQINAWVNGVRDNKGNRLIYSYPMGSKSFRYIHLRRSSIRELEKVQGRLNKYSLAFQGTVRDLGELITEIRMLETQGKLPSGSTVEDLEQYYASQAKSG
jgi:hypothetical protein